MQGSSGTAKGAAPGRPEQKEHIMNASNQTTYWDLAPGEIRVVGEMAGVEVRCIEGCVWMTQYGDDRDVVLEAGRVFEPGLSSVIVMSSANGARIAVHRAAAAEPSAQGVLSWLMRLFSPRAGSAVMRQLEGRLQSATAAVDRRASC